MFLIGETTGRVVNGKLELPKEYHLKKYDILGKWKGKDRLYLSDSEKSLNFIAGRESLSFQVKIDAENRIDLPREYEDVHVEIKGRISTVEIIFQMR